jgi:hypothetical protein
MSYAVESELVQFIRDTSGRGADYALDRHCAVVAPIELDRQMVVSYMQHRRFHESTIVSITDRASPIVEVLNMQAQTACNFFDFLFWQVNSNLRLNLYISIRIMAENLVEIFTQQKFKFEIL